MAHPHPPDSGTASLVESHPQSPATPTLDALAAIPDEHVWLASRKSPRTRRAYRHDVGHFMRTLGIRSADELRRVDHKAVLAWEAYMRKVEHAEASTVRRRLAALSSLFMHLVKRGVAERNSVRDDAGDYLLPGAQAYAAGGGRLVQAVFAPNVKWFRHEAEP